MLREADKVFVPGTLAKEIVSPYVEAELLDFPMTHDEERIAAAMGRNCDAIYKVASKGTAVLGILGDPNFFSTFNRLWKVMEMRYPDLEYQVEPGISSITAFASRIRVAVNTGIVVTDGTDPDCLVLLKVVRPREKAEELMSKGYRHFHLVERMFMRDEKVYEGPELPAKSDYMSIMFARR